MQEAQGSNYRVEELLHSISTHTTAQVCADVTRASKLPSITAYLLITCKHMVMDDECNVMAKERSSIYTNLVVASFEVLLLQF